MFLGFGSARSDCDSFDRDSLRSSEDQPRETSTPMMSTIQLHLCLIRKRELKRMQETASDFI